MDENINIGEELKKRRETECVTKSELAQQTGISHQNISRWENGQNIPNILNCMTLADFYKISLDELVGRESVETGINVHTQLTRQQQALLLIFDKLTHDEQIRSLGYMEGLYLNRNNQAF